jgi:hypothetical protein
MKFINETKKITGWLTLGGLSFALSIILGSAGVEAGNFKRVTFPDGANRVGFAGSVNPGERDTFVIALERGDDCEVDVRRKGADASGEGQGLSGFSIVEPDGEERTDAQDGDIEAETAGDYRIVVAPKTRQTDYRYRIVFKRF